jgi:NAD(P)-dependent dehydrogenase (short-subunit alcohol dehydrogenase family)
MQGVDGRVALVTGAAGAGIGRATARRLAAAGASVVVTDVHRRRTDETVAALRAEFPAVRIEGRLLDGGDAAQIERVVAEVDAELGGVDILVNNAAVNPFGEADTLTLEEWERALAVDITGPWLLIRAVLPGMKQRRRGSIVNVSSVAAWTAPEREHPYSAAKAALHSLTRTVAREAGPFGVRCNAVAPGLVWTRFMEKFEEQFRPEVERTPLRRWGTPEDVAGVVLFLASDLSAFITGEALTVSGGWYMHP